MGVDHYRRDVGRNVALAVAHSHLPAHPRQPAASTRGPSARRRTPLHLWEDRLVNWIAFWPLGADVGAFRDFHLAHHAYIGTPRDPELQQKGAFRHNWTGLTRAKKARLLLADLCGLNLRESLSLMRVVGGPVTPVRAVYIVTAVATITALGYWPLLLLWITALLTSGFAAMRARMWREHMDGGTSRYEARWWERAVYLPHYIWRHALHHQSGNWSTPAWDLR